jgi:DNA-binding response OmpR family regulator
VQTVLIVDDERNIRNVLDFSLGAEGYRVLEACDGLEAMVMARREHPDLIILDVMMPHADGFEVCRRLKDDERTAAIPVILLTARNSREDRRHGERMKADAYISKPFSPNRLLETVHSLLGVPKG